MEKIITTEKNSHSIRKFSQVQEILTKGENSHNMRQFSQEEEKSKTLVILIITVLFDQINFSSLYILPLSYYILTSLKVVPRRA